MTSIITETTLQALSTINTHTHNPLAIILGAITALLLLVLLVEKELTRSSAGAYSNTWIQSLNVAVFPLLCAFAVIVVMRYLDLNVFR